MTLLVRLAGAPPVDFDPIAVERFASWLQAQFSLRPVERDEAILVQQDGEPERLPVAEALEWLRSNGLTAVLRSVERTNVPIGAVVAIVVGDAGVRVSAMQVDDLHRTEPRPADGTYVPGQPWRRRKWTAPLPRRGGST